MHENVLDNIYATCIAITDETGETVLLFSTDLVSSTHHQNVRIQVQQATGVPQDHIVLGSTHTHSSVDQSNEKANAWNATFAIKCVEAAKAADLTDDQVTQSLLPWNVPTEIHTK